MGTGYIRNDVSNDIANNNVVDADDLDGEFDALVAAFAAATGHTHDGTAAEGGAITLIGPSQEYVSDGIAFFPSTDDTFDLGKASAEWKDLYIDGTGYLDSASIGALTVSGTASFTGATINDLGTVAAVDINGGSIDGASIGAAVQSTGDFTTLNATSLTLDTELAIAEGGTGAVSAADARTNLGVVIGTDVQAWDAILDATTASYTTAEETKLAGVEASATADQTGAEIKSLYEAEADTNAFTDADETKLDGIEALADVTDTANVTAAGALMDSEVDADIKTLSLPASTTISTYGASLVDDADAATARTTLGLGTAAVEDTGFFATAAQGALADTALQSADVISQDDAILSAIAGTITVTAVDVFVYDTSKDSDGGAWRKRTQGTSWYNETLDTATRGSRREFPAVAVIVAQVTKITIYDGDDPSLPMWMVLDKGGPGATQDMIGAGADGTNYSLVAKNGSIVAGVDGGLYVVDLLTDTGKKFNTAGMALYNVSISGRNSGAGFASFDASGGIVNTDVNYVAMTVLPDAPIDPATGLQVPTIAVATDGGVSVINNDGTVTDSLVTTACFDITVVDTGIFIVETSGKSRLLYATYADMLAGDGWGDEVGDRDGTADIDLLVNLDYLVAKSDNSLAMGSYQGPEELAVDGLMLHKPNYTTQTEGMSALLTSTYNTGWMNGDIKGAFLSDTYDTDLVPSGELVTNGTFDTDLTGWTDQSTGTGTATWSAGTAVLTRDVGSDNAGEIEQVPNGLVEGSSYAMTFTIGGDDCFVRDINKAGAAFAAGTHTIYSVKDATLTDAIEFKCQTDNGTSTVDNVSVQLVDADRSVNNKPLNVNGTVTRTAVATGADLVAYSGFSASNYLEQPYNSDLDFGTGDFCVMGWVKDVASGYVLLQRGSSREFAIYTSSTGLNIYVNNTAKSFASESILSSQWGFFVYSRNSGTGQVYINGEYKDFTNNHTGSVDVTDEPLQIGNRTVFGESSAPWLGDIALLRISATAPTAEQIAKIYNDEKFLFQENAQATLYGSSDDVTALAHDDATNLLHAGTSAGR